MVAPVNGVAAGEIARRARQAKIKFIAYDAPVLNAPVDYYVSFDNNRVGGLMGEFVKQKTKKGDTVVFISGAPQDDNAVRFQQGALDVLDPSFKDGTLINGFQTFTPNWDLNNAQREMEQALSKLQNNVQAVVAANDNLATGSISALRSAGLAGKVPVTGQDATATGLSRWPPRSPRRAVSSWPPAGPPSPPHPAVATLPSTPSPPRWSEVSACSAASAASGKPCSAPSSSPSPSTAWTCSPSPPERSTSSSAASSSSPSASTPSAATAVRQPAASETAWLAAPAQPGGSGQAQVAQPSRFSGDPASKRN